MTELHTPNTTELTDYINNSSTEVKDYLSNAIPLLNEIPAKLRTSDTKDGMMSIAQATEGLSLMLQYVQAIQSVPQLGEQAARFADIEKNLTEAIMQMANAMEQQDHGLLADIIEYELVQLLTELQKEVTSLTVS